MVTIRRSVKTGRQVVRRLGETRTLVEATATAFRPWEYLWEMDYREDGKSEVSEILSADLRRFWAGDKQSVYGPGLKLHQFRQDLRADSSGARPGCSATRPVGQMRFEGCAIPVAGGIRDNGLELKTSCSNGLIMLSSSQYLWKLTCQRTASQQPQTHPPCPAQPWHLVGEGRRSRKGRKAAPKIDPTLQKYRLNQLAGARPIPDNK